MKCLFCGKDLPLLKRLGGAEFCSEEHRQQYQQEYSELALSRLAQQKASANKAALPVKPQPGAEPASVSPSSKDAPRISPQPSMKLTETKADARRPRSGADAKNEPKLVATQAQALKPALVTKTSGPAITPVSPTQAPEPTPRMEAKKLSITSASAKPARSLVPLQETKPLKVTETRAPEAKTEANTGDQKAPEPARMPPAQEFTRAPRPSAHAPLRLELPVGPASTRLAPERRLIPTPEVQRSTSEPEPATTKSLGPQAENAPIPGARAESLLHAAIVEAPSQVPLADRPVIEEAALIIEGAARKEAGAIRHDAGEKANRESVRAHSLAGKGAEIAVPAPLAGMVQSQPPSADWNAAMRVPDLQMAAAVVPELPRGGIDPRAAALVGAEHLSSADILNPWAPRLHPRPARLEIREFARMEPVIEFKPIVDAPHVPVAAQAMALSFMAAALQTEPRLWAEPAREFGAWLDVAEQAAFLESLAAASQVLKETAAAAEESPDAAAPVGRIALEHRPAVNGTGAGHSLDLSREPQPVTLGKATAPDGIPGGKAKPVQMFTSTLRESVQAAVPYYDALPLRATILLGPSSPAVSANGWDAPHKNGSQS